MCDLVIHRLRDNRIDVRLVRFSPVRGVCPDFACSLARDPVGNAARAGFRVDLPSMTSVNADMLNSVSKLVEHLHKGLFHTQSVTF